MSSFFTNRGRYRMQAHLFDRSIALPTAFHFVLVNDSVTPTKDSNLVSEFTEIPQGNGYDSGAWEGLEYIANTTNFPSLTEDDTQDRSTVNLKDLVWTASGGQLPSSGVFRWCLMIDDNATPANREVYGVIDLNVSRILNTGQSLNVSAAMLIFD